YDLIKCINAGPEHKVWKLKVHVIRLWTVSHFANSGVKAPIEMVVLDEEGIQFNALLKAYLFLSSRAYSLRATYVIGQLASKGNLVEFTRDGKPSSYITIELDDLEGGQKLRVTLWQTLAFNLIKYLEEHPCLTYVVILQMGKMKFYSGVMGVSNIIYNSKLFINVEFLAARNFFTRVNKLDLVDGQSIMLLVCDQPVSIEEDFLRLSVYKIITGIKEHNQ
ncbi:hypothetical protein S83_036993, partial [Arachis hypogaea]